LISSAECKNQVLLYNIETCPAKSYWLSTLLLSQPKAGFQILQTRRQWHLNDNKINHQLVCQLPLYSTLLGFTRLSFLTALSESYCIFALCATGGFQVVGKVQ
jgi:hypothetical protein